MQVKKLIPPNLEVLWIFFFMLRKLDQVAMTSGFSVWMIYERKIKLMYKRKLERRAEKLERPFYYILLGGGGVFSFWWNKEIQHQIGWIYFVFSQLGWKYFYGLNIFCFQSAGLKIFLWVECILFSVSWVENIFMSWIYFVFNQLGWKYFYELNTFCFQSTGLKQFFAYLTPSPPHIKYSHCYTWQKVNKRDPCIIFQDTVYT